MQKIKLNNGKEYPIFFDFNVTEEMQERYDDISLIPEKMKRLKELKWMLTTLINEGIAKNNYDTNATDSQITEKELGMLLPMADIKNGNLSKTIMDAFSDNLDLKNAVAGDSTITVNLMQETKKATT